MVLQQPQPQPQPPCTLQHPAMDWHPNSPNHKLGLFFHTNSHIPSSDTIATPAFSTSCIRSPTRRAPARHAARPDPVLDFHESMRKRRRHATGTLKALDRLFEDRECMQLHSDMDDVNASSLRMHAGRDVDGGGKITTPLDPSLWKALPVEVIERIFACLPIASLFRFRAVCQSWNSAPLRLLFRVLRAHVMIPETWLMMLARSPSSVVQSRSASSSHGSCLSFVFNLKLSKPVALNDAFLPFPPDSGQFSYCTNAGGLICYHYHTGFSANSIRKPVSLWVGNPFTKEWKCLPPMVGSFPLNFPLRGLVGMVVLDGVANHDHVHTSQPTHYKIIVRTQNLHSWGSGMMTEEYDSHRNAWSVTTTANVPSDHRIEQVLHCNGSLYFLTWQVRDGIYVYHLANRLWSRLLPPKQHQFTSPHMVECCGHLVLVSGVGRYHTIWLKGVRQLHVRTTGIKLWQLVEKDPPDTNVVMPVTTNAAGVPMMQHGSSWSSLSQMPDELMQEFVTGVQFHCTSIHNLIYLTNSISMLIFHVVPRLWRRVIVVQIPFLVQEFVSFMPKLEASP